MTCIFGLVHEEGKADGSSNAVGPCSAVPSLLLRVGVPSVRLHLFPLTATFQRPVLRGPVVW